MLFADDTSLFSVARKNESRAEVNRDLETALWSSQWKVYFNAEKAEEVIYSTKRNTPLHDPLTMGNVEIYRETEHKHIGMVL